ncbi:hypothetical protein QAD02_010604 [Eretmocerus hayati]|uniref:Uncharacterized protein n=1 Tax=Eretmocerus hayati TaxID=131215 RepID=A0ACC2NVB2_9HYME|nr:hypothetical protein QAD02_010604 [Eretmocerus hayati]
MAYQCKSWILGISLMIFASLDSTTSWHDLNSDEPYSLTVGKYSGRKPACVERFYQDSTLLTHNVDFVTFDHCGGKVIGIYVKKLSKNHVPERVALISGGPGHSWTTLYFRSQKGEPMSADVEIYTE